MTSNTAQFFIRQRDIDWIAGWVTRRRDTDCPSTEVWPIGHMGVWEIVYTLRPYGVVLTCSPRVASVGCWSTFAVRACLWLEYHANPSCVAHENFGALDFTALSRVLLHDASPGRVNFAVYSTSALSDPRACVPREPFKSARRLYVHIDASSVLLITLSIQVASSRV